MPCDTRRKSTREELEFEALCREIEKMILAGEIQVSVNSFGELEIGGWQEQEIAEPGCVLHWITCHGSIEAQEELMTRGITQESLALAGHGHH